METLVRAIGALACVMSILGVVMVVAQKITPKVDTKLPFGLTSPGLAIRPPYRVLCRSDMAILQCKQQ